MMKINISTKYYETIVLFNLFLCTLHLIILCLSYTLKKCGIDGQHCSEIFSLNVFQYRSHDNMINIYVASVVF